MRPRPASAPPAERASPAPAREPTKGLAVEPTRLGGSAGPRANQRAASLGSGAPPLPHLPEVELPNKDTPPDISGEPIRRANLTATVTVTVTVTVALTLALALTLTLTLTLTPTSRVYQARRVDAAQPTGARQQAAPEPQHAATGMARVSRGGRYSAGVSAGRRTRARSRSRNRGVSRPPSQRWPSPLDLPYISHIFPVYLP